MAPTHVKGSVYMIDAEYQGANGVLGTYVIKGKRIFIADPGPTTSIPFVLDGLDDLGVNDGSLIYVAPTHIHLDHAGGSWKLIEKFHKSRLYVHPRGAQHMVDPTRLEAAARRLFGDRVDGYGKIRGVSADRIEESKDGELIDLGDVTVQLIWTPGHASHQQSYFVQEDDVAILGDAGGIYSASSGVIMPTTPPPFNPQKAVESLEKIIGLNPDVVCYGHFGFADDGVEKLETHKQQIELWSRIIEDAWEEGLEMEEIYDRIRVADPMAGRTEAYSVERRERSPFTRLLGFIEYFKWKKQQSEA